MPACSNRLNAAADGWTARVPLAFVLAFALDLGLPAIARTLADLDASDPVRRIHIAEALSYRRIAPGRY